MISTFSLLSFVCGARVEASTGLGLGKLNVDIANGSNEVLFTVHESIDYRL
jgi:hypothetical protein